MSRLPRAEEKQSQQKEQPVEQTNSEVYKESVLCLQTCEEGLWYKEKQGRREARQRQEVSLE